MTKGKIKHVVLDRLENLRSISVIMLVISFLMFILAIIVESMFFSSLFLLLAIILLITWTLAYSSLVEKIKEIKKSI